MDNSQTNICFIVNKKAKIAKFDKKTLKFLGESQALETLVMYVMCQCNIDVSLKVHSKCHPVKITIYPSINVALLRKRF